MPQALKGLRLVVTMPLSDYWYGRDLALAKDHAAALRSLGAEIFEFETTPFYRQDAATMRRQINDVKLFRPDAAISAPHAQYAAAMRWADEGSTDRTYADNVFLDHLNLPTVLYWDHVVTQAGQPYPNSAKRDDSGGGIVERLRALFNHPRAYHFFPDTGHIAELKRRGLGNFDADNHYVPGVPHDFIAYGERMRRSGGRDARVAFFGNLWLTAAARTPYAQAELTDIRQGALARCASDWELSPFTAFSDAIDSLAPDSRARLRLDIDQKFYWQFINWEVTAVANGEPRMRKLLACRQPIAYFGGFADPKSREIAASAGVRIERDLPANEELAAAYYRTRVSLDIVTAPFINGFSHKLLACFAAGGFMLTTRRADIAGALGDLADVIGFSSAGELAAKVEHYLNAHRERDELAKQIGSKVLRDYSTRAGFARTVPLALERIRMR
jgi:hypothetical protein